MSTTISDFRIPVRAVLGDFDATIRKYQDSAIDAVIAMIVNSGQLPGYTTGAANTVINPDVTGIAYGRLIYKAATAFVAPNAGAYSYRTRALAESFGEQRIFIQHLADALHDIENGGAVMLSCQLDFQSWFLSISGGFNPWAAMADMEVNAPVATVSIGESGVSVST